MKLPLVKRSVYNKDMSDKSERISILQSKIDKLKEDLTEAKNIAKEVLPKIVRVNEPVGPSEFGSYRLCVDVDRRSIERAFIHGNSDREIKFLAELLAKEIERKIVQFNFFRSGELR